MAQAQADAVIPAQYRQIPASQPHRGTEIYLATGYCRQQRSGTADEIERTEPWRSARRRRGQGHRLLLHGSACRTPLQTAPRTCSCCSSTHGSIFRSSIPAAAAPSSRSKKERPAPMHSRSLSAPGIRLTRLQRRRRVRAMLFRYPPRTMKRTRWLPIRCCRPNFPPCWDHAPPSSNAWTATTACSTALWSARFRPPTKRSICARA